MYGGLTWGANYLFASSAYASTDFAKQSLRRFRPQNMTADSALYGSLTLLIAQSRQLERSTPLGRAFVDALASELVGSGIGISPNTGDGDRDELLRAEFNRWSEHAMLDGSSLWAWQSACARELGTAGAALARILVRPERSAKGWLPLCIMPLEVEWLSIQPVTQPPEGHAYFRGIELDQFGLPVFYHLRHPYSMSGGERVAASEIIHIFEKRRPQQTHGEPMMAPVIERILQDARIVEAELQAALATSAPVGSITTEGAALPGDGDDSDTDDPQIDFQAGSVARLIPGEKIEWHDNKRVTEDLHPFRAEIRGDVAAAGRFSAWWLDRDPSRANYSSMRMDQLLSKRGTVSLKELLGTGCAGRPYEAALEWICLRNGIELTPEIMDYNLRPDQPEYVDPYKDVLASTMAIAAGLSTFEIEMSSRGKDFAQVVERLAVEKAKFDELGLAWPSMPKAKPELLPADGGEAGPEGADGAESMNVGGKKAGVA
ncbi:MAG: phage portal protein [Pseudomonadota bacterium]